MHQSVLERSFEPTDDSLNRFSNEINMKNERIEDIDRVKVLFVDTPTPKIISYQIVYLDNEKIERPNIHELLALKEELTYHDCLIVSTLYFTLSKNKLIQLICTNNSSKHYYNGVQLFRNANGHLIFAHQFEFLVKAILNASEDDAVKIRKAFNKRQEHSSFANYDPKKVEFLIKILNECMVTNNVYRPFYNGANVLREYILSIARRSKCYQ